MEINTDAFSHSQMISKIKAVEMINNYIDLMPDPFTIWVLGGWHGILPMLLLSHSEISPRIKNIRSYDIDSECEEIADSINNAWVVQEWKFKALTHDCNTLEYDNNVNLVMNTSVEHFDSLDWLYNIPSNTMVLLQTTNMDHHQHIINFNSIDDLKKIVDGNFDLIDELVIPFEYPNISFDRYMIFGVKR